MTTTADSRARNTDGTYTHEFLLWDAKLAFRVTSRKFVESCRHLRITLGVFSKTTSTNDYVMGLAMIRADTNPNIAARLNAVHAAQQELMDAAWELAEIDPDFDIRPLLPAMGGVA
ncbi:hypothetical protein ACWDRB_47365 [Nonomuraea sp. NPDC003707]